MTVGTLLTRADSLLRAALPAKVALNVAIAEDAVVAVDMVQWDQVLLDITRNAAHAMRERGGEIQISVDVADPVDALPDEQTSGYVRLRVSDDGEGMAPEVKARIFEPFFTTKPVGEGTGLGLAAVHGIVSSHGGFILVASELGVGTTFSIYLPRDAIDTDHVVPAVAGRFVCSWTIVVEAKERANEYDTIGVIPALTDVLCFALEAHL